MTLIDTSAWVEFLRDTGSAVCQRVDDLLAEEVATCDPIRMEVLAGARDEQHLTDVRRLLARASTLETRPTDYEEGAAIFRTCRRRGGTVRRITDCLIAAIAIRDDVPLLQNDRDFVVIARLTNLRLADV